ncbi:MAG: efflux RND transporter periplasmic adaptor subunit [Gammaproteobacteria bacterium]|nr:efflux RND transporter periplasmic adaptor subunit [Gammaproteobacteria bacterium]MBQ0838976.1 efflux RND transporter periplasmic adaptor subunit [Gammaproteobacteria bacterium]
MKNSGIFVLALLLGVIATTAYFNGQSVDRSQVTVASNEALYWQAPMDANYRRDEPGLSPMGMPLVPVYEAQAARKIKGAGVVTITPQVENNLGVRTAVVAFKPLDIVINTVGYVGFDEDRLIHIHPRVEGWVEQLFVKSEGESVQAGQPLYALYSPKLVAAQEEFVLALQRGNRRLIGSAEERLLTLQVAQTQINALRKSRKPTKAIIVPSPQDGVIANLGVREGMFVKPGTALMSVGGLDEVWVTAQVFERQAGVLAEGDQVSMSLDYLPGRQWRGQVDYIYPILDNLTRTVRVRLRFANTDALLKPNMFAQVIIHSGGAQPTLQVPREAVIRTGSQNRVVLALGDGRFKSVAVTLGHIGTSEAEILDGLKAGDRVVSSAHFLLDSESSIDSDFQRMAVSGGRDE